MAGDAGGSLRIDNTARGTVVVDAGRVADNVWARLVGLIGSRPLEAGQGLLIVPCRSIHMFFMGYAIDAIYLDRDCQVVGIDENLAPWRIGHVFRAVRYVLELPVGAVSASGTRVGDCLAVSGYRM